MEDLLSNPRRIVEMALGILIVLVFFGAIVVALVQIARGRFKVDYDKMAQEAVQSQIGAHKKKR